MENKNKIWLQRRRRLSEILEGDHVILYSQERIAHVNTFKSDFVSKHPEGETLCSISSASLLAS